MILMDNIKVLRLKIKRFSTCVNRNRPDFRKPVLKRFLVFGLYMTLRVRCGGRPRPMIEWWIFSLEKEGCLYTNTNVEPVIKFLNSWCCLQKMNRTWIARYAAVVTSPGRCHVSLPVSLHPEGYPGVPEAARPLPAFREVDFHAAVGCGKSSMKSLKIFKQF